jgi:hypothetical protein
MQVPTPDQVVSLLSLATFTFMNPVVTRAKRVPVVTDNLLLPLSDYDRAKVLKARAFPVRVSIARRYIMLNHSFAAYSCICHRAQASSLLRLDACFPQGVCLYGTNAGRPRPACLRLASRDEESPPVRIQWGSETSATLTCPKLPRDRW